jgi:hypothetical protein
MGPQRSEVEILTDKFQIAEAGGDGPAEGRDGPSDLGMPLGFFGRREDRPRSADRLTYPRM